MSRIAILVISYSLFSNWYVIANVGSTAELKPLYDSNAGKPLLLSAHQEHEKFKQYIKIKDSFSENQSDELSNASPVSLAKLFRLACFYSDYPLAAELLYLWKKSAKRSGGEEPGELDFYQGLLNFQRGLTQSAAALLYKSTESMRPASNSRVNARLFAEAAYLTGRTAYMGDKYEIAEKYLNAAMRFFRQSKQENPRLFMATLNYYGNLKRSQGYFDQGRTLLEEALEFGRLNELSNSAEYAEVLNDLGLMDWFEEELDSAKRLLEQGLNIRLMIFPQYHPSVTESLFNLAGVFESRSLFDEAEYYYRRCISLTEEWSGESNQVIWIYRLSLLNFLLDNSREHETEDLIAQLSRALDEGSIKNLNERLSIEIGLADSMALMQYKDSAMRYFRKAVKTEIELVRMGSKDDMRARNRFLQYLYKLRHYDLAEKLFRDAVDFRKSFYGPNSQVVANSQISLGDHLQKQNRCEAAIPLYQEALSIISLKGDKPGLSRAGVWQKMIRANVRCNRLTEALNYSKKIRNFFFTKKITLSKHLDLLDMEGKILLGLKDWSAALDLYKKGLSWIEMIPGKERPMIEGQFKSVLGELEIRRKHWIKARKHLSEADNIFIRKGLKIPMHYVRWCEFHLGLGEYGAASSYLELARVLIERNMKTEFEPDLIPIMQLQTMLYIEKKQWIKAENSIEESDLLIGMNPGTSLKHREIDQLQEDLKAKLDKGLSEQ